MSLRPRFAQDETERVVGYSVGLEGRTGKTIWFGGGSLDRDLSLSRLREFWEVSPAETAAAVRYWASAPGTNNRET